MGISFLSTQLPAKKLRADVKGKAPLRIESEQDVYAWLDRSGREWKVRLVNLLRDECRTPRRKTPGNKASVEDWCNAIGLMHKIVRLARDTVVKECMKKITELVARRKRQHSSESTQLPAKKLRANVAVSTTAAAECPVGTAAASSTDTPQRFATPQPSQGQSGSGSRRRDNARLSPASAATPGMPTSIKATPRTLRAAEALAMSRRKFEGDSPTSQAV